MNITHPPFGVANYLVLAFYFLIMLAIGWWAGKRVKGERGYFIAEGKIHYVLAGLSILGTYLSALTMMALPATSFGHYDWLWTVQLPCLLITAWIITYVVLPRYREAGVISVYQFLEQRIHVSVRMIAAVCFLALGVGRNGLILYLPALAFHIVTGANLPATIVFMGLIVLIYTAMGGMEGVIWTDAIQVLIFVLGAIVTLVYIFSSIWGSGESFLAVAQAHHKFRMFDWRLDPSQVVTLWLILQTLFETLRIYGTQQDMTQRYMTTESTAKANRSVWLAILGYIPLAYAFYLIGTALFVFNQIHPDPNVAALKDMKRTDALYAYFVVAHMPTGLAGLVIAAFFAATMSTMSAVMNSCSTVCVEDFYKRLWPAEHSDRHYLNVARGLTVLWGILTIAMSLVFMVYTELAQEVWAKVMAITTNGVLGLMALAFLPFRVNKWAALVGFAACYVCVIWMMFGTKINFLLWPVIGNMVCFGVGLALDRLLQFFKK